jgi:F-type H+-transporting ATPase subunit b
MGSILSELGQLFVQSIPTVIFVFLLFIVLKKILFDPVIGVLKKREQETTGALARAREQTAAAEVKTREYELAFQGARQEVYRQREADRQAGIKARDAALGLAREQAEAWVRDAQIDLATQVEAAKSTLAAATQSMANEIVEVVLSPSAGPVAGQSEGAQS